MAQLETVKVKRDGKRGWHSISKAKYDADPKAYTLHKAKGGEDQENPASADPTRNTSGTYSEPTPSDIRYPDKTDTEFESNLGAQIGKSAAGMREEKGLPDAPGGLHPVESWETKHRGRGSYSIMSGEDEMVEGLTKDEAGNFDKMSAEDKQAFVQDRRKA